MSTPGFLGIDLGTSSVKVLVQDAEGRAMGKAQRAYRTAIPQPGWAEQSPAAWWRAVCDAVSAAGAAARADIRSVGLSGQLNGFVLLDAEFEPLADAVIWLDLRAEAEARELLAAGGPDFKALTGNRLSAICVLPKLVWMARQRPELMARVRRIALAKDYVLLRLTGELATDPSDAGCTAMAAPSGLAWLSELCALAAVDVALLPEIRPSAVAAGRVTPVAADETGLVPGTPVATGAGDVAALALGCGIVAPERTAITLGTAGHVVAQAGSGKATEDAGLWSVPHALPRASLWLGLIMSGGLSLAWLRGVLAHGGRPPDYAVLERLAEGVPAGARGAAFLPFLEGAATPYRRPDARGAFFGLSSSHGAGDMVRAVMEGVAFNARECLRALAEGGAAPGALRIAEGGAQSALWCQIMADVLGDEVALITERDTSAAGAAMLGRAAAGTEDVAGIAEDCVHIQRRFEPCPKSRALLSEAFERYQAHCARMFSDESR